MRLCVLGKSAIGQKQTLHSKKLKGPFWWALGPSASEWDFPVPSVLPKEAKAIVLDWLWDLLTYKLLYYNSHIADGTRELKDCDCDPYFSGPMSACQSCTDTILKEVRVHDWSLLMCSCVSPLHREARWSSLWPGWASHSTKGHQHVSPLRVLLSLTGFWTFQNSTKQEENVVQLGYHLEFDPCRFSRLRMRSHTEWTRVGPS